LEPSWISVRSLSCAFRFVFLPPKKIFSCLSFQLYDSYCRCVPGRLHFQTHHEHTTALTAMSAQSAMQSLTARPVMAGKRVASKSVRCVPSHHLRSLFRLLTRSRLFFILKRKHPQPLRASRADADDKQTRTCYAWRDTTHSFMYAHPDRNSTLVRSTRARNRNARDDFRRVLKRRFEVSWGFWPTSARTFLYFFRQGVSTWVCGPGPDPFKGSIRAKDVRASTDKGLP